MKSNRHYYESLPHDQLVDVVLSRDEHIAELIEQERAIGAGGISMMGASTTACDDQPAMPEDAVLDGVVELAKIAHEHWDADRDMKVGKILQALAGWNEGYDRRADALHAARC